MYAYRDLEIASCRPVPAKVGPTREELAAALECIGLSPEHANELTENNNEKLEAVLRISRVIAVRPHGTVRFRHVGGGIKCPEILMAVNEAAKKAAAKGRKFSIRHVAQQLMIRRETLFHEFSRNPYLKPAMLAAAMLHPNCGMRPGRCRKQRPEVTGSPPR